MYITPNANVCVPLCIICVCLYACIPVCAPPHAPARLPPALQCPCPELGYYEHAAEAGLDPNTELVSRLASLALRGQLLGPGDVAKHMPSDLDAYYADDQEWRVML